MFAEVGFFIKTPKILNWRLFRKLLELFLRVAGFLWLRVPTRFSCEFCYDSDKHQHPLTIEGRSSSSIHNWMVW